MNISNFFINRPIFAGVLSMIIFMLGLLSIPALPISEFPDVVPPSIVVRASFPGATPNVIAETVATPLEEQISGVEDMLYIYSQSTTDGQVAVTVTFKLGTDPDKAQQLVQNRVNQALPRLPDIVKQIGVSTVKSSSNFVMVVHLLSPNQQYDSTYLRNYGLLNIKNRLNRIQGVGDIQIFGGGDYALRIWLDPAKMTARNLTAQDVVSAVREQNLQVAAGTIGGQPTENLLAFELPITATGRLQNTEEFENIIVRASPDGGFVRLKDVARVEMGASTYSLRSLLNNKQAAGIGIFQAPNSNALQIASDVRAQMEELKKSFPPGLTYDIIYDPTKFVSTSIEKVIHTLLEAVALVVLVVIVFLQTWRASLIPLLAVPVSIIGTFAVMHLFGFSINNLTLFGLVLAIGIVVDDAIVVVENVERNIERGLTPHAATVVAMQEVSGPIIAIALTLCAVFVPLAFIAGLTGQFYQQFALTIAISTVISAFSSLTLSPALSALLLKGHDQPKDALSRGIDRVFGRFFKAFNRVFVSSADRYQGGVRRLLKRKTFGLAFYAVLIGLALLLVKVIPAGYVPLQDKQYLVAFAQLPPGSSLERTEKVIEKMSTIGLKNPGIANAVAFPGLSISGFSNSSNAGIVFFPLKDFDERTKPEMYGPAIANQLMGQLNGAIPEAFVGVFPPPPVNGLGSIGGFKLQLEDRADLGDKALYDAVKAVTAKAYQTPALTGVFSGYEINVPQLFADLDRAKAKQLGVDITDVFNVMQVGLGSLYINDFNKFGRTYQVVAQNDAKYRQSPQDILEMKVRSRTSGELISLGSIMRVEPSNGPDRAMRYNLYRTADLNAAPAPGVSSGEAQAAMEKILKETLPPGITYEYTDLAYQQIIAGDTTLYIFGLCVLLVFMVLAAQYESLVLPMAIIMVVPVVLLCGMFGIWLTGSDNNIFSQIGLIVLVGLACKNAILIVEFARELEIGGHKIVDAALEACRMRLRPILMTSFAFIMGVAPLAISTGAGAEMRQAIGITVFSGMLGITLLGIFLTPMFYVLLRTLSGGKPLHSAGGCTMEHELGDKPKNATKKGKSHE